MRESHHPSAPGADVRDGAFPWHSVAIAGVHNTAQARSLPDYTSRTITAEAIRGAVADAGLTVDEIDGIAAGPLTEDLLYDLALGPAWMGSPGPHPILSLFECAAAIAAGMASTVVLAGGNAGAYADRASAAPWTRPRNEFVAHWGLFTAAEFALVARTHMDRYGTAPEHLAAVAATIRNNGHVNPAAVYHGRGPFSTSDILDSRMIADPFHLLDCSMTSEGGCALVLVRADRARDLAQAPVYILGAGHDGFGPPYVHPPSWDLSGRRSAPTNGLVGARASGLAMGAAGVRPADVDVLELYDPFSFEIIRQLEAYGFCGPGEGGPFVLDGNIAPDGDVPVNTDGGLLSYSHAGAAPQHLQRVIRGVLQLQGRCETGQVPGAEVALCSNGGAAALYTTVAVLGSVQP